MSRADAFRLLCGCLAQQLTEGLRHELRPLAQSDAISWETFVALASESLVAPLLHQAARDNGISDIFPSDVADYFDGMATLNRQRNDRILAQAIEIGVLLNNLDVVPVYLKGAAHLLAGLYQDSGNRIMVDLDILVPEDRLQDCVAALRQDGYEVLWDNGFPAHQHYPPMGHPERTAAVELHVAALDYPYERLLKTGEIIGSAVRVPCGGPELAVPSLQARVIHVIAHAQLSDHDYLYGRLALRDFVDYAWLYHSSRNDIDWSDICRRFTAARAGTALSYHVNAAQRLLGLPVPDEIHVGPLAKALVDRAIWQIAHPRVLDLGVRLMQPALLLRRSLSEAKLRRRLLTNLRDSDWYRRQLRRLGGQDQS